MGRIEEIIKGMTLKEKLAQMTQICFYGHNFEQVKERLKEHTFGSLNVMIHPNTEPNDVALKQLEELQKIAMETGSKIPIIFLKDVVRGYFTSYPDFLALSATFDPETVEKVYDCLGEEAYDSGIHGTLAPVMDLCHDPRWGRIVEGQGEDPYLAAEMGKACVKGFQTKNLGKGRSVAVCLKHFAGYGASEGGRDYYVAEATDYYMQNYVFPPFKTCIDNGVKLVMSSFAGLNGMPTSASKKLQTDILRGQLGFDGFVISDYASVESPYKNRMARTQGESAVMGVEAGVDMDMVSEFYLNHLEEMVLTGKILEETIDKSVYNILKVKEDLDIFERPTRGPLNFDMKKHIDVAVNVAEKAMVLLKNDGVLPLKKETKVYLTGHHANDLRDFYGKVEVYEGSHLVSLENALKNVSDNITVAKDLMSLDFSDATDSEVIFISIGDAWNNVGEAHGSAKLELKKEYKELIRSAKATGKKVVGILSFARPMAFDGIEDEFDAILYAWHCGSGHSEAVANIVYGKANPSAKLPVTLPRVTGQCPIYYNSLCAFQGYLRYFGDFGNPKPTYDDELATPAYPFGFGLSYSKFELSDIKCENPEISLKDLCEGAEFKINVKVKNIGDYDGAETVQLYIRPEYSRRLLPFRALKTFSKVYLKKGEEKNVTLTLDKKSFTYFTEDGEPLIDKTGIEVFVGTDCTADNQIRVEII